MSKKVLIRKLARQFLMEYGEIDTTFLMYLINEACRNGTTASELSNVLRINNEFTKIRRERKLAPAGRSSGSYLVCVWAVRNG